MFQPAPFVKWTIESVCRAHRDSLTHRASRFNAGQRRRIVRSITLVILTLAAIAAAWRGLMRADPDRIWREAEANIQVGRPT